MIARAALAIALIAAALFGGLRLADALATVNVHEVAIEGPLTAAERRQVSRVVSEELARPGIRGAGSVAAALEALGWVRHVEVRRNWPDKLHVAIRRETLAARWGDEGYITSSGDMVPVPGVADDPLLADLPVLKVVYATGPEAMRVFNLLQQEALTVPLAIMRLDQDQAGGWTARLADKETGLAAPDIEVALGATDLAERFRRFVVVYRIALADPSRRAVRLDARYDTGVAVRWQQKGAPPEQATAPRMRLPAATPNRRTRGLQDR